jgi:hypothetical protein
MKVPAIIACSLICLLLGVGIGAVGVQFAGYIPNFPMWTGKTPEEERGEAGEKGAAGIEAMMKAKGKAPGGPGKGGGGPPGGGGMPGFVANGKGDGKKGGGPGGPKGPSAKAQLSTLVAKLDLLTAKPLQIQLDDEQKKLVQEQLKGLDAMETLSDEEATKRLEGLKEALKDQKQPLEEIGAWPGASPQGGFGGPKDAPNPFREGAGEKHLQALQERLGKAAP